MKPILIIGGGIAGMTAAVEAAEVGSRVVLVEKTAYLGGRVLRMHRYFPKMCPPTCGFEINVRRIRQNPRIAVHTLETVEEITGQAGNFTVIIRKQPRFVTSKHGFDQSILAKLTSERPDDFNYGMTTTKAVFRDHDLAYPSTFTIDQEALSEADAEILRKECHPDTIDLAMNDEEIRVNVGAIIVATGWRPYDATKLDNLGFGSSANVLTNVMMERLASPDGPTGGEITRPSDDKKAKNIAFVQCAGSRDKNHLPYCSAVCCMGSLKQARYIREKNEDAKVTIFYIDIRTIGRLEQFYLDLLEDTNISFIKGKVAKIEKAPDGGDLLLHVEDTLQGENLHRQFDMVVLATGMAPSIEDNKLPFDAQYDEYGFIDDVAQRDATAGFYAAGCAKHPCDVSRSTRDATGAALKAIQTLNRSE